MLTHYLLRYIKHILVYLNVNLNGWIRKSCNTHRSLSIEILNPVVLNAPVRNLGYCIKSVSFLYKFHKSIKKIFHWGKKLIHYFSSIRDHGYIVEVIVSMQCSYDSISAVDRGAKLGVGWVLLLRRNWVNHRKYNRIE